MSGVVNRAWQVPAGCSSLDQLERVELPVPEPGPGEVRLRVHACSLNYRDRMIAEGSYFGGNPARCTLLSDGAGVIDAVGEGVTGFRPEDRAAGIFFQGWIDGPPYPGMGAALGHAGAPGMLTDYVVLPEQGLVPLAESLSFEEAACLPCAGVTAWNALMCGRTPLSEGASVLVLGSGGVSLLALQIARAAGARVIATSSSEAKRKRLAAMGADATIDYRACPEWGAEAARLAGGGVDHVVEVGGLGTLAQSGAAVGFGGEIALIGVLAPQGDFNPMPLMVKGASLRGIFVGSAAMARDLNAFIDRHAIRPQIDRMFDFEQVREALEYQASRSLFGKVVIKLGD